MVCGNCDWEPLDAYEYHKGSDADRLSEYVALRYRVLFEVWCLEMDFLTLTVVLCRRCGFLTYSPRPDAAEVDAKYRFLQLHERHIGGQSANAQAARLDRRRGKRICKLVEGHLRSRGGARVLDFGGGDGKLLTEFCERGYECFLVDYNRSPLAGIRRLGDTLDDLTGAESFDVVICSHVLEHLAEPAHVLKRLTGLLRPEGLLYAEVPFQLSRRGIPISDDPVTHINFFNLINFSALCQSSGLGLLSASKMVSTYDSTKLEALVVLASNRIMPTALQLGAGVRESSRFLAMSPLSELYSQVRIGQFPTRAQALHGFRTAIRRFTTRLRSRADQRDPPPANGRV
jgi:SAM-dependent methyltransferase